MPIDVETLLRGVVKPDRSSWDEDKVILYHLGVGAGADWLNPKELAYTLETRLRVLPSFVTIPSQPKLIQQIMQLPGINFPPHNVVHGEHEIILQRPLPPAGEVDMTAKVIGVYERGSGALLVAELSGTLVGEDQPLFTNRWSLFIRGEKAVGADPNPHPVISPPDRASDFVHESPLLTQQAQIYRLSGDKEPFHIDPEKAKAAGFDRPLLQGLCSYGVVCKAVVDSALEGDTTRLKRFRGRFAKPVFPGDTIITSVWKHDAGLIVHAHAKVSGTPVLSNAFVGLT